MKDRAEDLAAALAPGLGRRATRHSATRPRSPGC